VPPTSALGPSVAFLPRVFELVAQEQIALCTEHLRNMACVAVVAFDAANTQRALGDRSAEGRPGARAAPLGRRRIQGMAAARAGINPRIPVLQKRLGSTGSRGSAQLLDPILERRGQSSRGAVCACCPTLEGAELEIRLVVYESS